MTTRNGQLKRVAVVLAAGFLAACGGGVDAPATPKASAPVTVRGAIESTSGGLKVNGVTFRTTGAHLDMPDDSPTSLLLETEDAVKAHLDDGMVITVRGKIDDNGVAGQAETIEFRDLMEATIDDRGAGRVTVLGQDLSVDDTTHVEDAARSPKTLADLSPGQRVEVSGVADGKGGARATFIRIRDDVAPSVHHELKGYVVAATASILDLAWSRGGPVAVQVDISAISPAPSIAVGDLLEVTVSEVNPDPNGDGKLDAIALHFENELEAEHGDELEVEGIVSAVSAGGFTVAGQPVIPDANATWTGGTADDLVVGVTLEAEGSLGTDGVLHARKVKFEASVRIDANVAARDATAGTITLIGVAVHVTPSTELRGGIAGIGDLNVDDRIEIRGTPTADGLGVNASRVERIATAPADRAFLRAIVTAKTPTSSLTMLGIAIDTSAASFRNVDGSSSMLAADFFAAVTPDRTMVKVRWRNPYPASTAQAVDEAELEN